MADDTKKEKNTSNTLLLTFFFCIILLGIPTYSLYNDKVEQDKVIEFNSLLKNYRIKYGLGFDLENDYKIDNYQELGIKLEILKDTSLEQDKMKIFKLFKEYKFFEILYRKSWGMSIFLVSSLIFSAAALSTYLDKIKRSQSFQQFSEDGEDKITKDNVINLLLFNYNTIYKRIESEIIVTSRRSIINLTIGVIVCLFGVIYFLFSVSGLTFENLNTLFINLSSRVSVLIFLELIGIFFLKLYKENISDIKYYQNELTNSDYKFTSLITSVVRDDEKSTESILNDFSKVERNFKLLKGETTIELEKGKMEIAGMNIIEKLLNKLNINNNKNST